MITQVLVWILSREKAVHTYLHYSAFAPLLYPCLCIHIYAALYQPCTAVNAGSDQVHIYFIYFYMIFFSIGFDGKQNINIRGNNGNFIYATNPAWQLFHTLQCDAKIFICNQIGPQIEKDTRRTNQSQAHRWGQRSQVSTCVCLCLCVQQAGCITADTLLLVNPAQCV